MKHKIAIILIVLLAVSLTSVYAGNERRIGTAGAQELRIPVGARGTALGGAVVANVTGVEAIYWNPAGLASLAGTEAMFSYQPYLADIDINFAGVATRIEDFGTIAASAKIVSIGDMEETTNEYPDGTGRIFSPTLSVISVAYSRIMTNRVSFGVTGKFIHEKIFEVSATGVAFDVGFIYDPGWQGFSVGLAIRNYGPEMKFTGRGFERTLGERQASPEALKFDLPSSFNVGMAWNAYDMGPNLATIAGNFVSNNYSQDVWQGGAEYVYDGLYSIRVGYNYADQESYLYGFTVGGGVKYDFGGTKLAFEYSWMDTEVFDANQFFTVKMEF
jgi:hypothetical protein